MQNAACLQTTFGNAQHEGDTVQSSACCRRSTHLSVAPRHPRDELLEEVAGLVLAEPVGLHNSVEKLADGWKVYDVVVAGVSLVTNYRDTFNQEVRANGVDGLIDMLAKKNNQMDPGRK